MMTDRALQQRRDGNIFFPHTLLASLLLSAAIAFLFAPGCERPPARTEVPTIRLGHANHDHHSPFYVAALNPDYFKANGGIYLEEVVPREKYRLLRNGAVVAQVTADSSTGGKQLVRKLAEGHFDIAFGGVPALIGSIDSKPLLRIVAPVMTEGAALVVRREMPVSNWEDFTDYLRRETTPVRIGYKTAVSVQNLIFEYALRETGITYSSELDDSAADVLLLDMKSPKNLIPALEGGVIDGFVVNQPFPALAAHRGAGKTVASLSELPPRGKWRKNPCCALAAGNAYLEAHPEVIADFVTLMLRATVYIQENPEAAATQISGWLGLPPEVEKASIPTIFFVTDFDESWERGIDFWVESMMEAGKLKGAVREAHERGNIAEKLYDLDLFNRARERL